VGQSETATTSAAAAGPPGFAGSGDPQVQQLLAQMEVQWAKAAVQYDTATIGRMIAEDYVSVNSDQIVDRAGTLIPFGVRDSTFTPLYTTDSGTFVRVYGDAAVVIAIGRGAARNNKTGEVYRPLSRYVETWIRRNGQWQVVAGSYQDLQLPKATLMQQLMRAEQDYSDMFKKRDSLAFQRLVADSVIVAAGTDSVETKPELWGDVKGSDVRTNVLHVDRAYVSGGNVGVVNGTIDRTLNDGSALHLRYADTWVYRGGNWRLLARQLVPSTPNTR
jgi:ketosteroid isomerase-like protein